MAGWKMRMEGWRDEARVEGSKDQGVKDGVRVMMGWRGWRERERGEIEKDTNVVLEVA